MLEVKSKKWKCVNCEGPTQVRLRKYETVDDDEVVISSYCPQCDTEDADLYISADDLLDAVLKSEGLTE